MNKVALIYASLTGVTEEVVKKMEEKIKSGVDFYDAFSFTPKQIEDYSHFIIGSSTTGNGEMLPEMEDLLPELAPLLSKKTVAIFALGDAQSYGDSFVGSMKYIYDEIAESGCELVGSWPNEGYLEHESEALINGSFIGLALDEDSQSDLTDERIYKWLKSLPFPLELN